MTRRDRYGETVEDTEPLADVIPFRGRTTDIDGPVSDKKTGQEWLARIRQQLEAARANSKRGKK